MDVFSKDTTPIRIFGPTAGVHVSISGFGEVVGKGKPWMLVDMRVGASEIVDVRQCFGDVSFLYALGNNQSRCAISLTFAILIGRECLKGNHNTKTIKDGLDAYVANRISAQGGQTARNITIGNFSVDGWLTGVEIGQVDASKGICYGTVNFIMRLG